MTIIILRGVEMAMVESVFPIPEGVTFEQAIDLSQSLLAQMEQGLSEPQIEQAIAALVSSENGARGFFVTYLSGGGALADQPSAAVVQALQSSPEIVSELLVKNLAMSTAMAITHRRKQNEAMASGSDQVRQRTAQLLKLIQLAPVPDKAQALIESATTGAGRYQTFLERWSYDEEQKAAIVQSLQPFAA
jgi:hypothetical protein